MISGPTSGFQHGTQMFGRAMENVAASSNDTGMVSGPTETHSNSLIYNLSILKEKVQQVQSLVNIVVVPDHHRGPQDSVAIAVASMGTLIQEIIVTASSMMYTCQKIALDAGAQDGGDGELQQQQQQQNIIGDSTQHNDAMGESGVVGFFRNETFDNHYINNDDDDDRKTDGLRDYSTISCEVIELNVADLLAKYTHYCQICGKGFKRDANLRMHMRAHGDQYKSNAALSNPMKGGYTDESMISSPRKYSCPQEGCRWNKNHAKFQPLKSVICVKNHYKRSHCPKMYVCNRCNQKQFSLLSDLRTHEKHCGDLKWQCTCGTTFSRKDKLMGHVSLFIGHAPAVNCFTDSAKYDRS